MRPYRNLKIAALIEEELAKLLLRECDFDGALVTITGVIVGEDLLQARVKLAIIPYEKGPEVFFELDKRRGELQHKMLKKMNIRPMPHIEFEIEEPATEEKPAG